MLNRTVWSDDPVCEDPVGLACVLPAEKAWYVPQNQ